MELGVIGVIDNLINSMERRVKEVCKNRGYQQNINFMINNTIRLRFINIIFLLVFIMKNIINYKIELTLHFVAVPDTNFCQNLYLYITNIFL